MTAIQTLTKQNLQSVFSFDGQDDYISLPSSSFGGAITIEAWVYLENASHSWQRVVDFGNGPGNDNIVFGWKETTGKMALHTRRDSRGTEIVTDEVFPNKKWVHVVAVNDGNGNAYIYWDGELKASGTNHISPLNTTRNNQYIGRSNWDQDGYFIGKMAEVRIWNKARSQDEIKQDMNHRLTGQEEGLMAYLPLDKDTLDYSPNNNNGTHYGGTYEKENLDFIKTQDVEIANIFYDGDFAIHKADQYVEIRNPNAISVDLSGWKIKSLVKDKEFTFPMETSLDPNQTIRVYTNQYHAESGGFTFNSHWGIWKKSGDTAILLDAEGNEVSSFSYDNN